MGAQQAQAGTERIAVVVCGCSSQTPKREWQKVKKITGNMGFGFSGEEEEGWPGGKLLPGQLQGQLPC